MEAEQFYSWADQQRHAAQAQLACLSCKASLYRRFVRAADTGRWAALLIVMLDTFKFAAFLSVLFLCCVRLSAQPERPRNGLAVTGIVLSKKCFAWNKDLAELRLRFAFTNTSSQPIILNKSDLEVIEIKYFAFIDQPKDKVHVGQLFIHRLRGYLPEYDREIIGARPNRHFVILRPRQAYVFETTQSVPLIPAAPENATSAPPDEYQTEFELSTWVNHPRKLAESLRRRWARFGRLWSHDVWSETVEFVFPRNRACEP